MSHHKVKTAYLRDIYDLDARRRTFAWVCRELEKRRTKFDTIAFRGSSGHIAFAAALALDLPCVHVRKELGHSWIRCEGILGERVAIVDDFVASGDTVEVIMEHLQAAAEKERTPAPRLTHLFCYSRAGSQERGRAAVNAANPGVVWIERAWEL